jgi:hypothetical protein
MFAQISPTYEPPSTWRFWPETNAAWTLQRYAQAAAISSGVPRRALFGAAGIVHGIGKIVEVMVELTVKTAEWEGDENGIVVGATLL